MVAESQALNAMPACLVEVDDCALEWLQQHLPRSGDGAKFRRRRSRLQDRGTYTFTATPFQCGLDWEMSIILMVRTSVRCEGLKRLCPRCATGAQRQGHPAVQLVRQRRGRAAALAQHGVRRDQARGARKSLSKLYARTAWDSKKFIL